ncbi:MULTISPECIES: hypothetical protein [unclassified Duganella]|uniref:hypothetical protein n=1 Tax=unclassified Duganella TaxID=2636909 RepID=UPI00087EF928|nr:MULTISPECIES: hypothetical protein [unclassified Duganella]SDH37061.1 hypothetical protein SAMN05216320_112168 [Duganella sp. OV458]SDK53455.1 hypothetical protein SAMN05428973_112168 [Duganella sp. OV510]
MKPYQIVMLLALVASAGLVLFGDNSPSADIAEPVTRTASAAPAAPAPRSSGREAAGAAPKGETAILRLTPRAELVGEAGDASFAQGEGVFIGQNWNPPPPPPPPPSKTPPPPPMAPPLPFIYIGKAVADGAWEVYLSRGDKTYSARLQTVIDGAYRVEKIAPPLMTVTYLPLNQQQQMNIGVFE